MLELIFPPNFPATLGQEIVFIFISVVLWKWILLVPSWRFIHSYIYSGVIYAFGELIYCFQMLGESISWVMYNFLSLRELDHQRPWWRVAWGAVCRLTWSVCSQEHSSLAFPETILPSVYFFSSTNSLAVSLVSNCQFAKWGSSFVDGLNALNFWWLLWNNSCGFPKFLAYILNGIFAYHLQGKCIRSPKCYAAVGWGGGAVAATSSHCQWLHLGMPWENSRNCAHGQGPRRPWLQALP